MSVFILKVSHISLKKGSINKTMEREFWYLNSPIIKYLINISGNCWIIAECFKTAPNQGKCEFHPHFLNSLGGVFPKTIQQSVHFLIICTYSHTTSVLVTDIRILWLTDDNSFRDDKRVLQWMHWAPFTIRGRKQKDVHKTDKQVRTLTIHSAWPTKWVQEMVPLLL